MKINGELVMSRVLKLIGLLALINFPTALGSDPELKLVNVVYRHGDRYPDRDESFPTDPYINDTFYPDGRGSLTNEGKSREYLLGEVLKSSYGDFLGSVYYPELLEARSTDYDRTKMSLQLVLSALFPPTSTQIWNDSLLWQPIPTTYQTWDVDTLMFPDCQPEYLDEYNIVRNSTEVMEKISVFNKTMESLSNYTGAVITDPSDVYNYYQGLSGIESAGLKLPDWASEFYPNGTMLNITELYYDLMSYTDELKRLNGGVMLSKILNDSVSLINGTLDEGRKLYLYSGHETNVASLLEALGVWEPHVPAYSSAVIMELWEDDDEYYVKVLYYTGIPSEIKTLTVPGCDELCPIDELVEVRSAVITI